jgi:hypothetical protein
MSHWERLLLYAVALGMAVLLIFDSNVESKSSGSPRSEAASPVGTVASERHDRSTTLDGPIEDFETDEPLSAESPPIILTDALGRSRIELRMGDRGQPEIVLLSETGEAVVALRADSDQGAELVLQTGERYAVLRNERTGNLVFELQGEDGAHTRMTVSKSGDTEMSWGRVDGVRMLARTGIDGTAELALRGTDGKSGPTLSLDKTGDSSIRLVGPGGVPGPAMHLFQDGLGQVAIDGHGSESGPSMIRLPDGVAIMSVRLENGQPGAAMVASPDGSSVVATTSKDGKQQAALRIDAEGQATMSVTKPAKGDRNPQKPVPVIPDRAVTAVPH